MYGQQKFKIACNHVYLSVQSVTRNYIDNNLKNYFIFFYLWCFVPIPGHGLSLRSFAITLIGHLRTKDQAEAETCN
jgi:hypothetical protein